ncbi:hypothetical protein [Pseudomonas sp. RW3S2]|uniref:hypothetical protein n=1 Tax=Pseudomonas sp. RW3S2 TaxID=485884 RepID=UPI001648701C|nr:hypothetical protein [Pseudomonas sp. RW3S2]MBC3419538.1 hypothetical protein [Pseudomonas sp. RW3S2]
MFAFFKSGFPLLVILLADLVLWLALQGDIDLGGENSGPYKYFVMYVLYFTFFVVVLSVVSVAVKSLSESRVVQKLAYCLLDIPCALFCLVAGLLSLAVALNGTKLSAIPAILYMIAMIVLLIPRLLIGRTS